MLFMIMKIDFIAYCLYYRPHIYTQIRKTFVIEKVGYISWGDGFSKEVGVESKDF